MFVQNDLTKEKERNSSTEKRMREQHHQEVLALQKELLQREEKIENIVDKYVV